MLDIVAEVRGVQDVIDTLTDIEKRHVPFARAVALNRVAEELLAEARTQIKVNMVVRVPGFVLPPVQVPNALRATKARGYVHVGLGYPDVLPNNIGDRREKILRKFETGGSKRSTDPMNAIAIPSKELRPSFAELVPRAMYPVNLGLRERREASGSIIPAKLKGKVRTLSGGTVRSKKARRELGLEGIGGTFTIHDETGKPIGIFQRTGGRRREVRALWWFVEEIKIPKRIDFFKLAELTMERRMTINFTGAMELALSTSR